MESEAVHVPVAGLRPHGRRSPSPAELMASRRRLPRMDPVALRTDLETLLTRPDLTDPGVPAQS